MPERQRPRRQKETTAVGELEEREKHEGKKKRRKEKKQMRVFWKQVDRKILTEVTAVA